MDEEFWNLSIPVTESGCWLWLGSCNDKGYGHYRGKGAHRYSWEITNGKIPKGICICHKCDIPGCVNPAHLFLGTHADNMRDRHAKGRMHGEWNGKAKLKVEEVDQLLYMRREHGFGPTELGKLFGITLWHARDIYIGKFWTKKNRKLV